MLILCASFVLCGAATAFSQQVITAEKRALILELRQLTGTKNLSVQQEIKSTDIGDVLMRIIDADKELNSEQKQDLRKIALAAKDRLEREMRNFMADQTISDQLFEAAFVEQFDKGFTEDELREIVVFYRTPAGQKSAKFLLTVIDKASDSFSKALSKKLSEYVNTKLSEEIERLRKEIQRAKTASGDA